MGNDCHYHTTVLSIIADRFCGTPPFVANGSPGRLTSKVIGGMVAYSCHAGYILLGPVTVTCLSTGQWSTLPSCESE